MNLFNLINTLFEADAKQQQMLDFMKDLFSRNPRLMVSPEGVGNVVSQWFSTHDPSGHMNPSNVYLARKTAEQAKNLSRNEFMSGLSNQRQLEYPPSQTREPASIPEKPIPLAPDESDFELEPEKSAPDYYEKMLSGSSKLRFSKLTPQQKAMIGDSSKSPEEVSLELGIPVSAVLRFRKGVSGRKAVSYQRDFSSISSKADLSDGERKLLHRLPRQYKDEILDLSKNAFTLSKEIRIPADTIIKIRRVLINEPGGLENSPDWRNHPRHSWDKPWLPSPEEEENIDDIEDEREYRANIERMQQGKLHTLHKSWGGPDYDLAMKNLPKPEVEGDPYDKYLDRRKAGKKPANFDELKYKVRRLADEEGMSPDGIAIDQGINLKWVEEMLGRKSVDVLNRKHAGEKPSNFNELSKDIKELHDQGVSNEDIAKHFNVNIKWVDEALYKKPTSHEIRKRRKKR